MMSFGMGLHIQTCSSPDAFVRRAEPWLLEAEAENNLLLGLGRKLQESVAGFEPPIFLATIEDAGAVVGCAFRTPPFKLGITRMPEEALPLLVDEVERVYRDIPAVLGPEPQARVFAALWSERRGVAARAGMRQGIYQLERVIPPSRLPAGRLRTGSQEDVRLVVTWLSAFSAEAGLPPVDAERKAAEDVARGALCLWEDGEPRSMAGEVAHTPHGARIGYVYTPPEWRGRGYASACVAGLSQRVLGSGRRFCFLYTDLSNPTSNAIYQRIGYERVCDVTDYEFSAAPSRSESAQA